MLPAARTLENTCQWTVQAADPGAEDLARQLKIPLLLAQILINRQVTDPLAANAFLNPKLTDLLPAETMPGVSAAVDRVQHALDEGEKITLYGDYDVDGITGVSILLALLTELDGRVDYYIPHRIDEGYGLNTGAIESLARSGTKLLITVDCGITGADACQVAADLGMDVIITDHHQIPDELPRAAAIVHPLMDPGYGNTDSAGAMVAFKLAWAIANRACAGAKLTDKLRRFMLDATSLAAVGTVADIVDLRGENRSLTSFGLKTLATSGLAGISALIEVAGLQGKGLDSYDIGFKIGPMLNAAGRMGHARLAVELLAMDSPTRCREISEYLQGQNSLRQRCGRKIFKEACQLVKAMGFDHAERRSLVLAGENWHRGVVGIVASRIVDKYHLPAIVVNIDDVTGEAQGSARSIPGFSIYEGIKACAEHLVSFGGHAMAAGVTIKPDRIEQFTADFEAYARDHLNDQDVVAKLNVDAEVPLSQFTLDMVKQLQRLEPFGQGNPRPLFVTRGVRLISSPRCVGAKGDHLQLSITDRSHSLRCIGFGMGKLEKKLLEADCFDVVYEAQINTYNGNTTVQLVLVDIQFGS
ncbi:MAG: single-stranded-DNA-specific exonuclease RecJ [Planctomycetes bacterium]|nr:single-stranded-DNA-specific exonuclease RecJ [Planctomycetota bacterium]